MTSGMLRLYHAMPPIARNAVAHVRGAYLRQWRYGPATPGIMAEASEQEQWSGERIAAWQAERLACVLDHAATNVPYYRDMWAARRRSGDRSSHLELAHWPVLSKAALRANARAFVADGFEPRRLYHEHTSGTTGTPLDLWFSREAVHRLYGIADTYTLGWHGVPPGERWAMIGGQLVVPSGQTRPPFWVWNGAFNQLYMSSYHLAPELLPSYLDAMARYRVSYIAGYPSSLYELAIAARATGRRDLRMRVAITHAEPVTPEQRAEIESAFSCRVCETYGMAEGVARASECPAGGLHLWPQVGVVEVLDDNGTTVPRDATGELVCTGLLNLAMPLIRYAVGDRGALSALSGPCGCGRHLPRLSRVEGRSDDVLYARDGRRVGRLDPVFKSQVPIVEAQIIQEQLDRLRVRCVPAPGYGAPARHAIATRLRERLGDVSVEFEEVTRIPRQANGKFRAVICLLPGDSRRASTSSDPSEEPL